MFYSSEKENTIGYIRTRTINDQSPWHVHNSWTKLQINKYTTFVWSKSSKKKTPTRISKRQRQNNKFLCLLDNPKMKFPFEIFSLLFWFLCVFALFQLFALLFLVSFTTPQLHVHLQLSMIWKAQQKQSKIWKHKTEDLSLFLLFEYSWNS